MTQTLGNDLVHVGERKVHIGLLVALMCSRRFDKFGWIWGVVGVGDHDVAKLAGLLSPNVEFNPKMSSQILAVIVRPELERQLAWLKNWNLNGLNRENYWSWVEEKARRECGSEWISLSPINLPFDQGS